jgi:hypothetical protein
MPTTEELLKFMEDFNVKKKPVESDEAEDEASDDPSKEEATKTDESEDEASEDTNKEEAVESDEAEDEASEDEAKVSEPPDDDAFVDSKKNVEQLLVQSCKILHDRTPFTSELQRGNFSYKPYRSKEKNWTPPTAKPIRKFVFIDPLQPGNLAETIDIAKLDCKGESDDYWHDFDCFKGDILQSAGDQIFPAIRPTNLKDFSIDPKTILTPGVLDLYHYYFLRHRLYDGNAGNVFHLFLGDDVQDIYEWFMLQRSLTSGCLVTSALFGNVFIHQVSHYGWTKSISCCLRDLSGFVMPRTTRPSVPSTKQFRTPSTFFQSVWLPFLSSVRMTIP